MRADFRKPRLLTEQEVTALRTDAKATSVEAKYLLETRRLRNALQRIADLPLRQHDNLTEPNIRARHIAITALGGNPQSAKHRTYN